MHSLKEKVTDKLSRILRKWPSSASGSDTEPSHQSNQASKGGRTLSSFFSSIPPSPTLDGSNLIESQDDWKLIQAFPASWGNDTESWIVENLDIDVDYFSANDKKESTSPHGECESRNSAASTCESDAYEDTVPPHSQSKLIPNLTQESFFITSELYEFLQCALPNIVKGCQWVLLYSTLKHGISLRTLIRKTSDLPGPALLISGDKKGAVFGGLLECPLKACAKRKYQGTNQTFVFTTIYGEPRLFRPTGANRYFLLCLNDFLAFGGGGNFALSFDEDLLSGSSGSCETFGNECLAHDQEFELKNVELWGFTHLSRCPK
ncbi:hypothetical protein Droror1_Dr00000998 [Drosera rotundifolia]